MSERHNENRAVWMTKLAASARRSYSHTRVAPDDLVTFVQRGSTHSLGVAGLADEGTVEALSPSATWRWRPGYRFDGVNCVRTSATYRCLLLWTFSGTA
jgi:hypothetical protein